jgi:hypothetical protein
VCESVESVVISDDWKSEISVDLNKWALLDEEDPILAEESENEIDISDLRSEGDDEWDFVDNCL